VMTVAGFDVVEPESVPSVGHANLPD